MSRPNTEELSYLETQQKRIIQQIPRKTETLGGYDVKKSKKKKKAFQERSLNCIKLC